MGLGTSSERQIDFAWMKTLGNKCPDDVSESILLLRVKPPFVCLNRDFRSGYGSLLLEAIGQCAALFM